VLRAHLFYLPDEWVVDGGYSCGCLYSTIVSWLLSLFMEIEVYWQSICALMSKILLKIIFRSKLAENETYLGCKKFKLAMKVFNKL